jgi:NAD(P)-dependent dehydrogenase (short-subunit alcohol dehydrogenase family)
MFMKNIAIIGSSGALGNAFKVHLSKLHAASKIHAFSRSKQNDGAENITNYAIDYADEKSIEECASLASKDGPLDLVIVATGILHNDTFMPEKSLRDLSAEKLRHIFDVNTILPALLAKHFIPQLHRDKRSVFAALSARVGSISDNGLGGWYSYRASKAALNMIIKTAAIEAARRNKQAVIVGLHPGTVQSELSKPFQANVPDDKLFTPEFSVSKMLGVLDNLESDQSGKCFAWDGKQIDP